MSLFEVPPGFAAATIAREGDAGRRWIAQLPQQVEMHCARWQLVRDGAAMHGYLGLVVPVRRDGEPLILKISWIEASTEDEAAALAAWDGRGAVRLVAVDAPAGAMLLERLDARRSLESLEVGEALQVAARLLRRLAIPAPARFRPLIAVAEALQTTLPERWMRCGRPMPRKLVDRACALALDRAGGAANLLVNYDLHYANVLAAAREPWLTVDPKVVAGDPEYGVAQLLWCRLEEIGAQGGLAYHWSRLLEAAALDPALARDWTLVRCVDYWLWGLSVGLTEDPARCERVVGQMMG